MNSSLPVLSQAAEQHLDIMGYCSLVSVTT